MKKTNSIFRDFLSILDILRNILSSERSEDSKRETSFAVNAMLNLSNRS